MSANGISCCPNSSCSQPSAPPGCYTRSPWCPVGASKSALVSTIAPHCVTQSICQEESLSSLIWLFLYQSGGIDQNVWQGHKLSTFHGQYLICDPSNEPSYQCSGGSNIIRHVSTRTKNVIHWVPRAAGNPPLQDSCPSLLLLTLLHCSGLVECAPTAVTGHTAPHLLHPPLPLGFWWGQLSPTGSGLS